MPQLHIDYDESERLARSGKTVYHPIIGEVTGTSRYNDEQYTIKDLEGWWGFHGTPLVIGQTYRLILSTKPKASPDAKNPYMDILQVEETDETPDQIRGRIPGSGGGTQSASNSSITQSVERKETRVTAAVAKQEYGSTTDEKIKQAQVFNNTALVLAAMIQQPKTAKHPIDSDTFNTTMERFEYLSKLFWRGKEATGEAASNDEVVGGAPEPDEAPQTDTESPPEPPSYLDDAPKIDPEENLPW